MALVDEVARVLSEDGRFGSLAGEEAWSVYLDLMPDKPADAIALYPKGDPVRDGVREAEGVLIHVRGVRAEDTFTTLLAVQDVLAGQPLEGWVVWTDSNLASNGEEDKRRTIATADITCYRLCDNIAIDQFRRVTTSLAYRYGHVSTASDVPALVVSESVSRQLYRGAMVDQEAITVYLKAGVVDRNNALTLHTGRGRVDVDGIIQRGSGCARNVDVLRGARRVLV